MILKKILWNKQGLKNAFQSKLLELIKNKEKHSRLFEDFSVNSKICESSEWLRKGKLNPVTEENFCNVQDRNIYFTTKKWYHVCDTKISVDHLNTRCNKMIHCDYKKRHDEIVRIYIASLLNKYNNSNIKLMRNLKIKSVFDLENITILVDIPIRADVIYQNNKPDIF